ncbi:MAG: hypothetical protein JRG97_16520, partial [Deltaproteobacteria bacterium]|nr:hypothetical protein [Deltaproteobacteria bacterium]
VLRFFESSGLIKSSELKDQYKQQVAFYFEYKYWVDDKLVPSRVQKNLKKLKKDSQRYIDAIDALDPISKHFLMVDKETLNNALNSAEIMYIQAQRAFHWLTIDKGGRPENFALKYLIDVLAKIYEEAKGEKPETGISHNRSFDEYSGLFFSLVKDCLEKLGDPPSSDQALGKAVSRVLKKKNTPIPSNFTS